MNKLFIFAMFLVVAIAFADSSPPCDQACSDAKSKEQQAASDSESKKQQSESDSKSAAQQKESDSKSSSQQKESDAKSGKSEQISTSDGKNDQKKIFYDEKGNWIEVITKTEKKDGEEVTIFEEKIIGADGSETITKTKTEIKDGQEEIQTERKFTGADGKEVIIKTKSEIENGEEEISNLIEVKGAQIETKLSVKAESKESGTILKAELSTGAEQNILVLPDQALQTALNELQTANGLSIEIKELSGEDGTKAVFSATANKQGRLLGIFDVSANLETLIDTETGEIIKTTKPWWAAWIVGINEETICHVEGMGGYSVTVPITSVKERLALGDSLGSCPIVCGDGIVVRDEEECDDGNLLDRDGCSAICEIDMPIVVTNSTNSTNGSNSNVTV